MSINFGDAVITLGIDQNPFIKGIAAVRGGITPELARISTGITAAFDIASNITSQFQAITSEFVEMTGKVDDLRNRTGLSASALTSLGHAAVQTGSNMDAVANAVLKMQKTLTAAQGGAKASAAAFEAIGISVGDLSKLTPDQQFVAIADAISQIPEPAHQSAAAFAVFGKGASSLLPLLKSGKAGIQELQQEADRLGITLGDDTVAAGAALGDAIDKLNMAWKGFTTTLLGVVAPALTWILDALTEVTAAARSLWENLDITTLLSPGAALGGELGRNFARRSQASPPTPSDSTANREIVANSKRQTQLLESMLRELRDREEGIPVE